MNQNADAIIVGGGIAGAATVYYLAKAGLKPILCEKGEIAGEQSSRLGASCASRAAIPSKCR